MKVLVQVVQGLLALIWRIGWLHAETGSGGDNYATGRGIIDQMPTSPLGEEYRR